MGAIRRSRKKEKTNFHRRRFLEMYSTKVMLGVSVSEKDLYKTKKERGCYHDILVEEANYCSVCSKPIWQEKREPIEGYVKDALLGFNVVTAYDQAYIGMIIATVERGYVLGRVQFKHFT